MYLTKGIIYGAIAFFLIGPTVFKLLDDANAGFMIAVMVGLAIFWHYSKMEKARQVGIDNPMPIVTKASLPEAFGAVADAIKTVKYGPHGWQLQEEQDSGVIQARMTFQQMLGGPNSPEMADRDLTMKVTIMPIPGSGSIVTIVYPTVHSPKGRALASQLLEHTTQAVQFELAKFDVPEKQYA